MSLRIVIIVIEDTRRPKQDEDDKGDDGEEKMSTFSRSVGALCQSRKMSTQLNLDTANYIPRVRLKLFWQPKA